MPTRRCGPLAARVFGALDFPSQSSWPGLRNLMLESKPKFRVRAAAQEIVGIFKVSFYLPAGDKSRCLVPASKVPGSCVEVETSTVKRETPFLVCTSDGT